MGLAINVGLLILGTTGALAAFGGETWKKGSKYIFRRITRRGWLALVCMLLTLGLGVAKEILTNVESAASSAHQHVLESNLAHATADLGKTTADLGRTTTELHETRAKLAAVEPNILEGLIVATAGIRRESDFSTPTIRGESMILLSGRTNTPLSLYGGDNVEYTIFCDSGGRRLPDGRSRLILSVGDTDYPLLEHGRQMIIGPIGQPMPARIMNPEHVEGCQLKILIESADRTREAKQIQPLVEMIKEARASLQTR